MKYVSLIVCTLVVCFAMPDQASAQRGRKGVNQTFRFLGAFHSAGYHYRTPGPCVGYYNPYSRVNTHLVIGGVPQGARTYLERYMNSGYQNGYDSKDPYAPGSNYKTPYSQPIGTNYYNLNAPAYDSSPNVLPAEVEKYENDFSPENNDASDLEEEVQSIMEEDASKKKDGAKPNGNYSSGKTGQGTDDELWPVMMNFEAANQRTRSSNRR